MNILLQDKFTYDLININDDISKTIFLVLLTLYTPTYTFPFNKEIGCSLYENITALDIKNNFLQDLYNIADFYNLKDYYNSAIKTIENIEIKDVLKYNLNDNEIAVITDYENYNLNPTYQYIRGILVTIFLNNGDTISIAL